VSYTLQTDGTGAVFERNEARRLASHRERQNKKKEKGKGKKSNKLFGWQRSLNTHIITVAFPQRNVVDADLA
ncbi:hypothetical protein JOB18_002453, partial [Solea senegalensis]